MKFLQLFFSAFLLLSFSLFGETTSPLMMFRVGGEPTNTRSSDSNVASDLKRSTDSKRFSNFSDLSSSSSSEFSQENSSHTLPINEASVFTAKTEALQAEYSSNKARKNVFEIIRPQTIFLRESLPSFYLSNNPLITIQKNIQSYRLSIELLQNALVTANSKITREQEAWSRLKEIYSFHLKNKQLNNNIILNFQKNFSSAEEKLSLLQAYQHEHKAIKKSIESGLIYCEAVKAKTRNVAIYQLRCNHVETYIQAEQEAWSALKAFCAEPSLQKNSYKNEWNALSARAKEAMTTSTWQYAQFKLADSLLTAELYEKSFLETPDKTFVAYETLMEYGNDVLKKCNKLSTICDNHHVSSSQSSQEIIDQLTWWKNQKDQLEQIKNFWEEKINIWKLDAANKKFSFPDADSDFYDEEDDD